MLDIPSTGDGITDERRSQETKEWKQSNQRLANVLYSPGLQGHREVGEESGPPDGGVMAPLGARTMEEERREDIFLRMITYQVIHNNKHDINKNNNFKVSPIYF